MSVKNYKKKSDGTLELRYEVYTKSEVDTNFAKKTDIPTVPTVNNGTLTIKAAGTSKGTFTANQSGNTTIDITAADLGLSSAMKFIGTSATAITDGATTNPITIGSTSTTVTAGNVVLYGAKEFVWTGSAWEELGNEGSYALSSVKVEGTGALSGGGNLTANRTITHNELNTSGAQGTAKVWKQTLDEYGHVLSATAATYSDVGACASNDSRLSNARNAADVYAWAKKASLSAAINDDLSEGTSDANREDYIVAQYASGGTTTTTYHRRKLKNIFKALNSSDITTALGFTPTSNTGTVTSVDSVTPSSGNVSLSAVRYVSQSLTTAQKTQARSNIGAGTSNFSGSYSDLSDKPSVLTSIASLTTGTGFLKLTTGTASLETNPDAPSNMVTTDSDQTISAQKTFSNTIIAPGIQPSTTASSSNSPSLGAVAKKYKYAYLYSYLAVGTGTSAAQTSLATRYGQGKIINYGSSSSYSVTLQFPTVTSAYTVTLPSKTGTLATTSDIPSTKDTIEKTFPNWFATPTVLSSNGRMPGTTFPTSSTYWTYISKPSWLVVTCGRRAGASEVEICLRKQYNSTSQQKIFRCGENYVNVDYPHIPFLMIPIPSGLYVCMNGENVSNGEVCIYPCNYD